MSRREQIKMSAQEVASFLAGERTVTCATIGPRGWPHLMPLWYVLRDPSDDGPSPRVWAWTYAISQKVRNLERDPRATLQVETGEAYEDLRGVMLECDVVIHRDLDTVAPLGGAILQRNSVPRGSEPAQDMPSAAGEAVKAQASKRVGLEFIECGRATWDHRKLGGVY
jgi:Pyridoxamine 5'-phosphate oxidase